MKKVLSAVVVLSVIASGATAQSPSDQPIRAAHAMVVTIHHDATDTGLEILREGGNAVDAAVAVGFALAVVYPAAGNIGGGGFMLIRPGSARGMGHDTKLAHGQPHFLDYREEAPAAASANMYLDANGNIIPKASITGSHASGVPGTVAGLTYAEHHYGRLTLAKVMAPAIRLARDGYTLSAEEADELHSTNLTQFPSSRVIFQRDGNFYQPGDLFKQPELADTLTRIAADPADFYHGKLAAQIAAFEAANQGLITAADLAHYKVKERTPLIGHYHGLEVLTSPPPSSGGIVLLEILNILSGYNLPKIGPEGTESKDRSPDQTHYIVEAFRRAYMDRGDYLGDPDFNKMPLAQLANPAYARAWRKTIDPSLRHPRPSRRLHARRLQAPPPPLRVPGNHPLLHRRRRRQRRLQHLHPKLRLRLRRHRRPPRLPPQRRDGRLHLQGRRAQRLRPRSKLSQRDRPRQAPTLLHESHHRQRTTHLPHTFTPSLLSTLPNCVISTGA
jgi:gamma-glutamyltranspeptidase/glutathione hydrolase